jgi:FlaG/FlaF family flagellin (archaellin)
MYGKSLPQWCSILSIAIVFALALVLVGCGSGSSQSSSSTPPTSTALVNIGDSPSDRIVAFAMTINSITLSGSAGTTTVMSSPTVVEMTGLMGSMQPLSMLSVPQGTYTSATINAGSALVSFMNPTLMQKTVSVGSTTINFSSPMTVGSTPVVFNFDMDRPIAWPATWCTSPLGRQF